MTRFDAVLWDLDGTIVDTEPLWMAGEHLLAERYGAIWTHEDGLALVGSTLLDAGVYIKRRIGADLSPAEIVDFLVVRVATALRESVPWRPGARELILALADDGVPQALVTMSYASIASAVADQLPFGAVITGDAVTHGKPHPEPYLAAAAALGVDPERCLAIEDSGTGATSANAAGCHVLAVPNMVQVPSAPRRAELPTLDGTTPDTLWSLFG